MAILKPILRSLTRPLTKGIGDASPARGPELVVGGTFDSGVTGWGVGANATLTNVSGAMRVTAVANGTAYAVQVVTTPAAGKLVEVVADYANLPAGRGARIVIYNITDGLDVGAASGTTASGTLRFTATCPAGKTLHLYAMLITGTLASEFVHFDNISMRQVIA